MRRLSTAAVTVTVLSFAFNAEAQTGWSGVVTTVSAPVPTNGFIFRPVVAVEPNGNAHAVWNLVAGAQTNTLIQAARYVAATGSWSTPMTLAGPGAFGPPDVAVDPFGNAFYLLTRSMGGASQVQVIRYDGTSAATNSTTLSFNGILSAFGQVGVDPAGNAMALWEEPSGIYGARYDRASDTWATPVKISADGALGPQLVIDQTNEITAVWIRRPLAGGEFLVQAARFNPSTLAWSPVVDLSAPSQAAQSQRVALDATGNVTAVWVRSNGLNTIVQSARFVKASGTWSGVTDLSLPGTSADAASVAADPAGNVISVWRRFTGATYIVQTARFDAGSGSWSSAFDLSSPSAFAYPIPTVRLDPAGNAIALWGRSQPGLGIQIQAARFTAASALWSTPVELSTPGQAAYNPDVDFDAAGNGTAMWFQTAGGLGVIQSTRWIDQPPGAPTELVVTSVTGNTVTLAWKAPTSGASPTGYVLEGGSTPGAVLASLPTGSAATTFTLNAPSGVFFVRLHARLGNLRSAASNEIQLVVNAPLPPSAPAALLGLVNGSTLSLSWTNTYQGGTPTTFQLNVTGAQNASIPFGLLDKLSFNGVPGGTYSFTVTASNASGVSPPSNSVTLTFPGTCSGPPSVPTYFAVAKSGSSLALTWQPPVIGAAATGYVIHVSGSFTGSVPTLARSLIGTAGPGTYSFSVTATNVCGTSAPTQIVTVTVP